MMRRTVRFLVDGQSRSPGANPTTLRTRRHMSATFDRRIGSDGTVRGVADSPHRYPIEALAEAMRESYSQACDRLGIGGGQRNRISAAGGFTMDQAEHYANRVGFHPWNIWPEMVDHLMEDEGAVRSCVICSTNFPPRSANHICCSPPCQTERDRRMKRERRKLRPWRPLAVCRLPGCTTVIVQKRTGRTRLYCCDDHQHAAERARARARASAA